MMKVLRNYIKKTFYLPVLIGFNVANAGSYDDFFTALKNDDPAMVQQLLLRGFDVNTLDPKGQPGLLIAIRAPSLKAATLLIDAPKINLNAANAAGESPLMLAALTGQLKLADYLVQKGADVNKPGWTPLHYAASNGHREVIKLLLENHAYIDAESPNGSTPLMMASMYGNPQSVKLLLDEGADPLLKNQGGLTALQFAQRGNRPDSILMLTKAMRSKQLTGKW
jgi:ankyrin repeat protein